MSAIEIEAKTTKEAIEKACKHFNLSEEELDIEVLESRSVGIFGLAGNKKAKIRVTPKRDNSITLAQEILTKIISLISPDTKISAEKKGDDIILNIEGNNPGILIGPKGKTLEALEFIINKAVNKASERKVRVIVDAENYRQRREEFLKRLAFKMGERAKKTKKTVTIDPISPHDRRIVHLALKGDYQLQTKSNGEGFFKKVFIIPNKKKIDKNQND
ncbi:MAG: protein jag [Desulfobacteraceae bacterium]|nr:MAG: protein jag [Desulfobacteraceae bacterium]